MKSSKPYLTLVSLSLLLSACVTGPQRIALSDQDKTTIQSNQIFLNTTQREILMKHNNWFNDTMPDPYGPMDSGHIVQHNAPYNPNQGLLGAVIVAGIEHHGAVSATESIAPVRNALSNFDFIHYFDTELKQKVSNIPWLKVKNTQLVYNVKNYDREIVASAKANTTLFIGTTYALNSTFKRLEVTAYVKLLQKPESDKQQPKTLYANNFYFINRLDNVSDWKTNRQYWADNNASLLKSKLRDAATLLSSMIASDMRIASPTPYANITSIAKVVAVEGLTMNAKLIKQERGYSILSLVSNGNMNGFVYIVTPNEIIK